jgi:hypothetical protein
MASEKRGGTRAMRKFVGSVEAKHRKVIRLMSKNEKHRLLRYSNFTREEQALLSDFPKELWPSYVKRAAELGIRFIEFLQREGLIDAVRAKQLSSMDFSLVHSGQKPSPERITNMMARLSG